MQITAKNNKLFEDKYLNLDWSVKSEIWYIHNLSTRYITQFENKKSLNRYACVR